MIDWPFQDLPLFGYDLIMADPPWSFDNWSKAGEAKNAKAHYDCMPTDEIAALPVNHLAGGDCVLWLWATNPMLPQALRVMNAWGFEFKTAGSWIKTTSKGNLAFGTGYLLRSANEPFLIGTCGSPKVASNVRSAFYGQAREHSRKPEECFEIAEHWMPKARRLELFSREKRPGWDNWGLEAEKFNEEAA
jgi:N6-adenosine-specific RNA methylase IME4